MINLTKKQVKELREKGVTVFVREHWSNLDKEVIYSLLLEDIYLLDENRDISFDTIQRYVIDEMLEDEKVIITE